jgi:hypothetical protein
MWLGLLGLETQTKPTEELIGLTHFCWWIIFSILSDAPSFSEHDSGSNPSNKSPVPQNLSLCNISPYSPSQMNVNPHEFN